MFKIKIKISLVLLTAILISGCSQQNARPDIYDKFIDNGSYVKVNGHSIYYQKKGQGTPTVIFESGGDSLGQLSWFEVQEEVSEFATTISYDRAGIFRSELSSSPRTCESVAYDLHTLLQKLNAKRPYILAAHSMGGLFARCYMKKYPNGFDGIVLVDASHPYQVENAPEEFKDNIVGSRTPSRLFYKLMMYFGGRHNLNREIDEMPEEFGGNEAAKRDVNANFKRMVNGDYEEIRMFSSYLLDSRGASFNDVPLIVLSAAKDTIEEKHKKIMAYFSGLQKDALKLSTDSKLINVDSDHYIQIEKPDVLIDAIKEIINKVN